jgi:hypothetical protein
MRTSLLRPPVPDQSIMDGLLKHLSTHAASLAAENGGQTPWMQPLGGEWVVTTWDGN